MRYCSLLDFLCTIMILLLLSTCFVISFHFIFLDLYRIGYDGTSLTDLLSEMMGARNLRLAMVQRAALFAPSRAASQVYLPRSPSHSPPSSAIAFPPTSQLIFPLSPISGNTHFPGGRVQSTSANFHMQLSQRAPSPGPQARARAPMTPDKGPRHVPRE